ncbi:hypothetical protein [Tolypothrix sp. NIES-4075]|uniref:hypothetical protein n=1 Tax=Tolypothrix sp. NIES-4075 TaxID=2005459 RepID=UPI001F40F2CE|nr:hypothetical protein [Tolypothrix sp. NIES-4075]
MLGKKRSPLSLKLITPPVKKTDSNGYTLVIVQPKKYHLPRQRRRTNGGQY